MALFTGEGGGTPLFDSSTSLALRRRSTELLGLGLVGLAGLFGAILYTYHPDDPSLWNVNSRVPQNALGMVGAMIADPLIKFIGLASWGLVAFFAIWGWRCLIHVGCERVWARLLLMPLALVSLTMFFSTHGVIADWPAGIGLGGLFGDRGVRMLLDLIPTSDSQALMYATLGLVPVTAMLSGAALGMNGRETLGIWRWLSRSFAHVMSRALAILGLGAMAGARATGRGIANGVASLRERRGRVPHTGRETGSCRADRVLAQKGDACQSVFHPGARYRPVGCRGPARGHFGCLAYGAYDRIGRARSPQDACPCRGPGPA